MGKEIQSKNWADTALGPIEHWPQNLQLAFDICLGSKSPISIFWGDEYILLYNEAYGRLVGDCHPQALGQPANEVFGKAWHKISPIIEEVYSTGEAADTKSQHLFFPPAGNRCYQLAFSPISGENGSVDGVLNIANETTEYLKTEKRKQHIEKALQIETVGVVFFNMAGEITDANDAFLKMSGYNRQDLASGNMRWDEMTPPEWMETSKKALEQLRNTGTTRPYEKQYFRKDGSRWWALFSSKYLEDDKSVEFVLDISQRKRNEQLQKEQKKLLELIASDKPFSECLKSLCSSLTRLSSNFRASILLADEASEKLDWPISPERLPLFIEGVENAPINDFTIGICGKNPKNRLPISSKDIASDENWSEEWRNFCISNDIRACHSEPILDKDNNTAGSLMLCFNEAREPNEWEYRLMDFGIHVASIAIERERSKKALKTSEEKYRTLFESIDEGFCIIEMIFDDKSPVDFRFLEANPAFARQSGLTDVVGKTMRELIPDHEDYWFEILGRVATSGNPRRFEKYTKGLDRWLDLYAFPVGDQQNHKVAIIFDDITERKKDLQEHKRLLKEVETEQNKLKNIFNHAPSVMALMRGEKHIIEQTNELYRQVTGDRKLIGKTVREALPEIRGQGLIKLMDQVYETGEPYKGNDVRIVLEHPSGPHEYYFNFVYQPVRDADGSVSGIFVQGVDLTERKHIEEQLKEINDTLEYRVQERTRSLLSYQNQLRSLASQLSKAEDRERQRLATELHDNLGQMLAVSKMRLDLLPQDQLTDDVKNDITDIRNLVDDALVYTRELMSDLKPPPSINKEDISRAMDWVARKMEKHGLKVTVSNDSLPKPLDDELRTILLQCVRELLFNVLKHAEVDKARITVTRKDNEVQITVEDSGRGFDPAKVKPISVENGQFGLFNIRERMDLLDGSIDIISQEGEGTKVVLHAPIKEVSKPEVASEQTQPIYTSSTTRDDTDPKIRVLLVDDHEMMRVGLRKIVDDENDLTVVGEAADGVEAVQLAHETTPDIIVMDVNMPRMNGIDATQKIISEMPNVRIIGLSLHDHKQVIESMRSAGATAYLTKNEAFETLTATIRSEASLVKK